MTVRLFDEAVPDLADRASAAALNDAMRRYKNSPYGLKRTRLHYLQKAMLAELRNCRRCGAKFDTSTDALECAMHDKRTVRR
jgi:hypothetical protein